MTAHVNWLVTKWADLLNDSTKALCPPLLENAKVEDYKKLGSITADGSYTGVTVPSELELGRAAKKLLWANLINAAWRYGQQNVFLAKTKKGCDNVLSISSDMIDSATALQTHFCFEDESYHLLATDGPFKEGKEVASNPPTFYLGNTTTKLNASRFSKAPGLDTLEAGDHAWSGIMTEDDVVAG